MNIISRGKKVLEIEIAGLQQLLPSIDYSFVAAVDLIRCCRGKVIVSGMGKAGLIGKKIAATFSSLGISSFYMHPAEASHGDLGMVTSDDVVLLVSNSGESVEVNSLLPSLKSMKVPIIAICAVPESVLAKNSQVFLNIQKSEEACEMNLVPTTSTTKMLAMGDALAITLMRQDLDFDQKRFAFYHPGGSLGKRLMKVNQIMRIDKDLVLARPEDNLREVLKKMTHSASGCAIIVDKFKKILGIFTDGDLRRSLDRHQDLLSLEMNDIFISKPKTILLGKYVLEAVNIIKTNQIGDLPVIDQKGVVQGVIHIKDLVEIGLI